MKMYSLGKTSYGGEVFALEADKHFEIPALRCVISHSKIKDKEVTIEEAVNYFNKNPSEAQGLAKRVHDEHKHSSIGEAYTDGIYLKGVSRLFTFLGWIPIGGSRSLQGVGTERPLRRVRARGYVDNGEPSLRKLCEKSFEIYNELVDAGYEPEDVRYILPLATKTEEIMQIPMGREFGKWSNYLQELYFTEAKEIGKILKNWNTEKTGFEVEELPARENFMPLKNRDKIPQRKFLERVVLGVNYFPINDTFLAHSYGSIASFHQEVRNRQERIFWPSLEESVLHGVFVIPPSLKVRFDTVSSVYKEAQELGERMWKIGKIESAVYAQPLGKDIDVISYIHGSSNIVSTFMLRTCYMAQSEIRSRFEKAAKLIEKTFIFGKLGPRCEVEGKCYEPKRKECPKFASLMKRL